MWIESPPQSPKDPQEISVDRSSHTQDDLYKLTSDVLSSLNISDTETYFRNLTSIKCNTIYTLPSGNKFKIAYDGIIFYRNNQEEHWKISAPNKWAAIHVDKVKYHHTWWELTVIWKKRGISAKQDPQLLSRKEIATIFDHLDKAKTYMRPKYREDGNPYNIILKVEKK